jgi:DNA replication ATP-dependent helicase Dna2
MKFFDYLFFDEASQVLEPYILSAILLAKKWILVGDHNQLSPLLKNETSRMKTSFFEFLLNKYPEKSTKLTI